MTDTPFVFELVSGVYVDAQGNLLNGPPPAGAQKYDAGWTTLPADAAKIRDALKDIKGALDDVQKNKTFLLDLHVWADPATSTLVLDFIKGASQLVGAIAPIFAVVTVVAQVLQMLKVFSSGPDPLQLFIQQRFDDLTKLMVSQSQQDFLSGLGDMRAASNNISDQVLAFSNMQGNLTLADYLVAQGNALALLVNDTTELLKMFETAGKWNVLQDATILKTWQGIQGHLFCLSASGAPSPCTYRQGLQFDHRAMVPFVVEATNRYLTCLRTLAPEYRSTSQFAPTLRRFAEGLKILAATMRDTNLARTIYTADDFNVILESSEVTETHIPASGGPSLVNILHPNIQFTVHTYRWPVGALDVLLHNDNYIKAQMSSPSQSSPTRAGCMDYAWSPPAQLQIIPSDQGPWFNQYSILNPQACADAANEQSAKDYAELLTLSGYVQLMHLSALCRQQATEPNRSETVAALRPPLMSYSNVVNQQVTVESNWMLGLAHVTAKATQRSRDCWANVRFKTQPIRRAHPLMQYRVVLRTLPDLMSYADYFRAGYEPDPANPGFLKMSILRAPAALDSKAIIADWTTSPADAPLHKEKTVTLKAHTYNWYVPMARSLDSAIIEASKLSSFHKIAKFVDTPVTPKKIGATVMSGGDPFIDASDLKRKATDLTGMPWFVGQPPLSDPDRSPREKQTQDVEVQCILDWDKDDLTVSLHVSAAARSVAICVVLEEKLISNNNNILETATEVPMDCLVSYVPEKFFEDEAKAIAQAGAAIAKNIPREIIDLTNIHVPGPVEINLGLVSPAQWEGVLKTVQAEHPARFENIMTQVRRDLRF